MMSLTNKPKVSCAQKIIALFSHRNVGIAWR